MCACAHRLALRGTGSSGARADEGPAGLAGPDTLELAKNPQTGLKLDMPLQVPVATFKIREQRVYVLSFEDWIEEEFKLTPLQRQSADWAAKCCGGYVLTSGAYGVRLDPLLKHLQKALQRRRVRKVREQIARELAEIEAARKKADLSEKR